MSSTAERQPEYGIPVRDMNKEIANFQYALSDIRIEFKTENLTKNKILYQHIFGCSLQMNELYKSMQPQLKPPKVTCKVCGQLFWSMSARYDHHKKVHRNEPYVCKICGKEYQSRGALHNHTSKHTEGKTSTSTSLETSFSTSIDKSINISNASSETREQEHEQKTLRTSTT